MRPHLPWVTLTSTAAVIPMPASAAITCGAKRPDDGRGRALMLPVWWCGPGTGGAGTARRGWEGKRS